MHHFPTMRRAAPLALLSTTALLLVGCSSPSEGSQAEPAAAGDCGEFSSGAASDSVSVEGTFGEEPTTEFEAPLTVDSTQRTIVEKGDGDVTAAGDSVDAVLTMYNGDSGDKVFSESAELTVQDSSLYPAFIAGIDCVPIGSRVVTVVPSADLFGEAGNPDLGIEAGDAIVVVTDVLEPVEPLEPVEWTEDVPKVEFGDAEVPTVTLPDTDPPTELELAVLKKGDGETVQAGDSVTVDYQGTSWNTGEVFDQSYGAQPATFPTTGVIKGFQASLVGQKVGSRVISVMPPELAYGTDESSGELGGQTLVFLIDIQATDRSQ